MAKLISDILDTDRVKFRHLVESWDARSGNSAHDLHLYSDMRAKAVWAVKHLGLDPTDTISRELYFALQDKAKDDNQWLAEYLKVDNDADPKTLLENISKWVSKNSHILEIWTIKQVVIRNALKKQPPKNLMKALGLRSVDSMLKRNSPSVILCLATEIESPEWVEKFVLNYKKVKASDFDVQKINFEIVDQAKLAKLYAKGLDKSKIVHPSYETASIVLLPPAHRFPLDVLAICLSLIESINELRRKSAFMRTVSLRKDFANLVYNVSSKGLIASSLELSEISWNSIHRHLVGNEDFMTKLEQPYISLDEFQMHPPVEFLSKHSRSFDFWKDLDYVFYHQGEHLPVSMNLIDVATNANNRYPYEAGVKTYGKSRLWEELWARYLSHDNVAEETVSRLLDT